jgi:hypothetical protein
VALCSVASEYGRREASSAIRALVHRRGFRQAGSSRQLRCDLYPNDVGRGTRALEPCPPRPDPARTHSSERRQRQWQVVAKRPRTEPVDTDTQSAEQALLPTGDLLGVLQNFESASRQHSGLRVQWTGACPPSPGQLSLVSRGALGCATRACTQLSDRLAKRGRFPGKGSRKH